MESYIADVKCLQQFMEDGSFLMPEIPAALRALQALGAPDYMDYDFLMSITGMAVRLAWQPGWAAYQVLPNQAVFPDGTGFDYALRALDGAGAKYIVKSLTDTVLARKEIQAAIDKGKPVLLDEPFVCSTVLGYKENVLYGVSTFAPPEERTQPYQYNPLNSWCEQTKRYVLIERLLPQPVDRQLLAQTIKRAITMARTSECQQHPGAAMGLSAFDALAEMLVWDESFQIFNDDLSYTGEIPWPYHRPEGYWREDGAHSLADRFWAGYCDFLCMLNGYENMSRFLNKYADIVPEWRERVLSAAGYYQKACDYSGELWKYVTPDEEGVRKFRLPEVRYTFAAHMLRAKMYTLKAVEELEKIG